ncbi:hypothetical protein [Herbiconiux daphne]|uniref:Uncharacterized protein n=1 Tax=Herbiconiux daphne TaxID=2970914 RepID=A0ABT2HBD5_9MICO|nr:hypothetical protein [Herbiconiux daphne]MCS5737275.1 hypothetical protein [Herbiconiux daphne]
MANEVCTKGTKITDMSGKILGWLSESDMKKIKTRVMLGADLAHSGEITIAKASFELSQPSQHIYRGCRVDGYKGIYKFSIYLTKAEMEYQAPYFNKHVIIEKV